MTGGKHKQPLGYTIVEVMIVLAISSIMFLIAAQFINGKQEQASFKNGVNTFASQLQNTIDQVTNGQYSDLNFTCTLNYSTNILSFNGPNVGQTSETQGTNPKCVFLGKLMYFYAPSGSTAPENYDTFTLAGANTLPGGVPPTDIDDADPAAVITGNHSVDLTVMGQIPQNLELVPFASSPPNSAPIRVQVGFSTTYTYAIGVTQTWSLDRNGDCVAGSGDSCYYSTGYQAPQITYSNNLNTLVSGTNAYAENTAQSSIATPHTVETANSAELCLTDGTHWADIKIGMTYESELSIQTSIRTSQCA
jgi:prepilin-type N-terminal cleavage/methylation domain-containing protein